MLEDARVAGAFQAKDHLISLLQSRYTTIAALNTAWGTSFTGWTDPVLLNAYTLPSGYLSLNASQVADFDAYMSAFAGQYYSVVRTALKASDPNHLYLGSRLASWTPPVYSAAALYCDVVSFNIYKLTLDSSWNFLDTLGKPAFVGEFNFAATDRGGFNTSLVAASSQADRAAKFQAYIASAMGHSGVVGCNWFQYVDEPISGRYFDGENSPMGSSPSRIIPIPRWWLRRGR